VLAECFEKLTDETVRSPVSEADAAAFPRRAGELGCRILLVRGEHDAEGRENDIEAAVGEGQRLGVRLSENDGQMLCGGTLLAAIKQSAYVVG
jgi:hypothetical protein